MWDGSGEMREINSAYGTWGRVHEGGGIWARSWTTGDILTEKTTQQQEGRVSEGRPGNCSHWHGEAAARRKPSCFRRKVHLSFLFYYVYLKASLTAVLLPRKILFQTLPSLKMILLFFSVLLFLSFFSLLNLWHSPSQYNQNKIPSVFFLQNGRFIMI